MQLPIGSALALALALVAAPAAAQQFTPLRSIEATAIIDDEYYNEYETDVDSQVLTTTASGWWDEAVTAEATLGGSVTYADAFQSSWADPATGWFEADGFAAGGLYSQLNGEMKAESLVQLDFQVASAASVDFTFEAWFGNSFGGLTSHDRPGQATAEVRVEDGQGGTVYAIAFTYDDGFGNEDDSILLGPGTYRLIARAEILDETFFETVYGSMTTAGFYFEGVVSGGSPVDLVAPATPTGLAPSAGDAVVDLSWNANTEPDLAGYEVRRGLSFQGPFQTIATVSGESYSDTSVSNGTTYYYAVAAYDSSSNVSDATTPVAATPLAPPPTPSSVHVDSITVSFVHVQGAKFRAVATVRIVDDLGAPVSGATVSGTFSGSVSGSPSATTNSSGIATLLSNIKKWPTSATFCVTNVSAALPYAPGDNVETCDSN